MSQQGYQQASIRALTGTANDYNGDWHALFDMRGIAQGEWNGRLLAWINLQMTKTYTSLPEAMQAYAASQSAYNWSSMGAFTVSAPYDPASDTLFAAITTPPTASRKAKINSVIVALKAAGVWSLLDGLWVTAAADAQAALLNWINPGTNDLTAVNTPTFTADRGYVGNGTTSYLNTGLVRNAMTHYAQDSASFSAWNCLAHAATGKFIVGTSTGSSARMTTYDSSSRVVGRINNSTDAVFAVSTPVGLSGANRSASTAAQTYKDGALVKTGTAASTALSNETFYLLRGTSTYDGDDQISAAHLGASLTAAQWASLYAALYGYMRGVGAA